jgi:polyferredoxin
VKWLDYLFLLKDERKKESTGPSWHFRRKLIFGGYRVGVLMIVFGMFTFIWDRQVSVQLVIGGVALISIILTAYTATATLEDVKLWQPTETENTDV